MSCSHCQSNQMPAAKETRPVGSKHQDMFAEQIGRLYVLAHKETCRRSLSTFAGTVVWLQVCVCVCVFVRVFVRVCVLRA